MSEKKLERIENQINKISNSVSFRVTLTGIDTEGKETGTFTVDGQRTTPGEVNFYIPEKILECLLVPEKRYYLLRGSRSAGKSHSIARFCIALAVEKGFSILCLREVQKSLKDSVHRLLKSIIDKDTYLSDFFDVGREEIRGNNDSVFIFAGCAGLTVQNLKSYEDFLICWISEGQTVTKYSWDIIQPTIRADGARFFLDLNPMKATDALFQLSEIKDDRVSMLHVTFEDNFFCPKSIKEDAAKLKVKDEALYNHIYGGGLLVRTDKNIFKNWITQKDLNLEELLKEAFERETKGLNRHRDFDKIRRIGNRLRNAVTIGIDYGVTAESAAVLVFHDRKAFRIYIFREFYQNGFSPTELGRQLKKVFPELLIGLDDGLTGYFDSAHPGCIMDIRKTGLQIESCGKKVEILDRIAALQNYEIIVDESCQNFVMEISGYSWQETNNGIILEMVDKSTPHHLIDALAYSLRDTIIEEKTGYEKLNVVWG